MSVTLGQSLQFFGDKEVKASRHQHFAIFGATGSGKSTLMKNMIHQDVIAGDTVVVIDPHGELVNDIAGRIPPERRSDVIYLDPADDPVIGLNPLQGPDKIRRLEEAITITAALWGDTSWLAQSDFIGRNIGEAVILYEKEPVLHHLYKALMDETYLAKIFENVPANLKLFYKKFKVDWDTRQKEQASAPPTNKLDCYNKPYLRQVISQPHGLELGQAMNDGKIILCNFSKGKLGPEVGSFLSSIFLSMIQFSAFERTGKERHVKVYIDEVHNCTRGHNLEHILSELRKYRVFLVLADQSPGQLQPEAVKSIFANVGTLVAGNISYADSETLTPQIGHPLQDAKTLTDLEVGEWYLGQRAKDAIHFKTKMLPKSHPGIRNKVIEHSRKHWGTPRKETEKFLAQLLES